MIHRIICRVVRTGFVAALVIGSGSSVTASAQTVAADRGEPVTTFGSQVDRSQFRVQRSLPKVPAGPALLQLDAHVLARPRGLADVRLVDDSGRQVPYLVERPQAPVVVVLTVPARREEGRTSSYRFRAPLQFLPPGSQLVLTTSARTFERAVTLRRDADSHRSRRRAVVIERTWRNTDPSSPESQLVIELPAHRAGRRGAGGALEVLIDEGDNAPLPIESARILIPAAALRFEHPGIPLSLVYGNPRARAPRYDIALLPRQDPAAVRVMVLPPIARSNLEDEDPLVRKIFWLAIAVAAIVLIALLMRLLRPETSRAPSDST